MSEVKILIEFTRFLFEKDCFHLMSINWKVILKLMLFAFLWFASGIVSTIFYLEGDIDFSKLDGTLIATIVLAVATIFLTLITAHYAISTREILDDQRKSRQIGDIEKKLELLYYPLKDVLSNPIRQTNMDGESEEQVSWMKVEEIIPYQYLAFSESKDIIDEFIEKVIKSKGNDASDFNKFKNHKVKDIIEKDVGRCKDELNELISH
ncbi:MAG: hypothetical protein KAR76_02405 [Methanosarcinales archaeon]|nr:hypothetical protein [Methanosarcinales archaeon]